MRITDFEIYQNLLKDKSGLVLSSDKSYLLDSRLSPIAKKWGYDSLDAMTAALQGVPDKDLVIDIVEAMTTNETSFFRDSKPFEIMKQHTLPYMMDARQSTRKLKLWCTAASSGQEPYSVAMLIKGGEIPGLETWQIDFVATDISNEILDQARNGIYSQFEVQRGLEITTLVKFFTQDDEKWQINSDIRNMIRYEYFNLLDDMSKFGKLDIIFCRNVLIYFDEETKKDILERMAKQLEPDGFLFLGGAETVIGITDVFKPVPDKRGLYALSDSPHAQQNSAATSTQAIA